MLATILYNIIYGLSMNLKQKILYIVFYFNTVLHNKYMINKCIIIIFGLLVHILIILI